MSLYNSLKIFDGSRKCVPKGFPGSLKRRRRLSKSIRNDDPDNNCKCCGIPYNGYYTVDPKSLVYCMDKTSEKESKSYRYHKLSTFAVCETCWDDDEVSMDDIRKYYIKKIMSMHSSPDRVLKYIDILEKSLCKEVNSNPVYKLKYRESILNKLVNEC